MSEVKRYDMRVSLGGVESYESTCGDYVDYEDYAELEAKCAALAAENVALNGKMDRLLSWSGIEFYSSAWEFCNIDGDDALEFICDKETQATDAFLAEIERKAIRKFINSIEHILRDKMSPYDTEEMLEAMRIFLEEQGGAEL